MTFSASQPTSWFVRFAAVLAVTVTTTFAQAQLPFQESFETEPGTSYTIDGAFDDGSFDYFGRYAVPDTENGARDDFANGWDGGFGIHSQDNDGEGGSATATVNIPGIDISGSGAGSTLDLAIALTSTGGFEPLALDNVRVASDADGLVATLALGALASEAAGFDNYDAEDGDGIAIFATIDGGAAVEIGRFSPPASGTNDMGTSGDLYLDPDGDGVGTGLALSADLTDFAFPIPAVPEPSSYALGMLPMLGVASLRKRR